MLYLVLPLMFSGLALMHCSGGGKEVIEPLVSCVVCANRVAPDSEYGRVACTLDSWYDFRTRLKPAKQNEAWQ